MNSAANRYPAHLKALIYGFISLWVILAAFPFFWTLWGSFKVELDFSLSLTGQMHLPAKIPLIPMARLLLMSVMPGHGYKKEFYGPLLTQRLFVSLLCAPR